MGDHKKSYGKVIAGISLGSPSVLSFCQKGSDESRDVFLPPRSLYLMTGHSRYNWEHGMHIGNASLLEKKGMERRVSLTYRNYTGWQPGKLEKLAMDVARSPS